jgi:hypothetical protein
VRTYDPSALGSVLYTFTPGAARSTRSFFWENPATLRVESVAATDTTDSYEAGYEYAAVPALPAAGEYEKVGGPSERRNGQARERASE